MERRRSVAACWASIGLFMPSDCCPIATRLPPARHAPRTSPHIILLACILRSFFRWFVWRFFVNAGLLLGKCVRRTLGFPHLTLVVRQTPPGGGRERARAAKQKGLN